MLPFDTDTIGKIREAEGEKQLIWDWKQGDLYAFTTAVDEQLSGSGPTDGEYLTQMY